MYIYIYTLYKERDDRYCCVAVGLATSKGFPQASVLLLQTTEFLLISIYFVLIVIDALLIAIAVAKVLGFPQASMFLLKMNLSH